MYRLFLKAWITAGVFFPGVAFGTGSKLELITHKSPENVWVSPVKGLGELFPEITFEATAGFVPLDCQGDVVERLTPLFLEGEDIHLLFNQSPVEIDGVLKKMLEFHSMENSSPINQKPLNLDVPNSQGKTAIEVAYFQKNSLAALYLLRLGANAGCLLDLLLKKDSPYTEGEEELSRAIAEQVEDRTCLLLELGMDIHKLLAAGPTVFVHKVLSRMLALPRYGHGLGARRLCNLDQENKDGETPLEVAYRQAHSPDFKKRLSVVQYRTLLKEALIKGKAIPPKETVHAQSADAQKTFLVVKQLLQLGADRRPLREALIKTHPVSPQGTIHVKKTLELSEELYRSQVCLFLALEVGFPQCLLEKKDEFLRQVLYEFRIFPHGSGSQRWWMIEQKNNTEETLLEKVFSYKQGFSIVETLLNMGLSQDNLIHIFEKKVSACITQQMDPIAIETCLKAGMDREHLIDVLETKRALSEQMTIGERQFRHAIDTKNVDQARLLLDLGTNLHLLLEAKDSHFVGDVLCKLVPLSMTSLVQRSWNFEQFNEEGKTPLGVAYDISGKTFSLFKHLMKLGAKVDPVVDYLFVKNKDLTTHDLFKYANKKDKHRVSLLLNLGGDWHSLLASQDKSWIKDVLLEVQSDFEFGETYRKLNRLNAQGQTPVEVVYEHLDFFGADILELILKLGGDFHPVVMAGDFGLLRNCLLVRKVNLNAQNRQGQTLLSISIAHRDDEIIKLLLKAGADVHPLILCEDKNYITHILSLFENGKHLNLNTPNKDEKTPLDSALVQEDYEIVDSLLLLGAHIHPLILNKTKAFIQERLNAHKSAIQKKRVLYKDDLNKRMLGFKNLDLDAMNQDFKTPLDLLVQQRNTLKRNKDDLGLKENMEIIAFLLSSEDFATNLPLHALVHLESMSVLEDFLNFTYLDMTQKKKIALKQMLNRENKDKETPLYRVVKETILTFKNESEYEQGLSLISILVREGANIHGNGDNSPFKFAFNRKGFQEVKFRLVPTKKQEVPISLNRCEEETVSGESVAYSKRDTGMHKVNSSNKSI